MNANTAVLCFRKTTHGDTVMQTVQPAEKFRQFRFLISVCSLNELILHATRSCLLIWLKPLQLTSPGMQQGASAFQQLRCLCTCGHPLQCMRSITPFHCARVQGLRPCCSRVRRCQQSCWPRARRCNAPPRPSCAPTATGFPGSQPRLCIGPYRLHMDSTVISWHPCKTSKAIT